MPGEVLQKSAVEMDSEGFVNSSAPVMMVFSWIFPSRVCWWVSKDSRFAEGFAGGFL